MQEGNVLLIANILSLIGNVVATSAALLRSKNKILVFQSSNHVLEIIAQLITKAYSGMAQEAISLVRNLSLVFIKSDRKLPKFIISVLCLIAGLVVGILLNIRFSGNVLYGYLPIAGAAIYAIFVILAFMLVLEKSKEELLMKIGLLFNGACWSAYGVFVKLYPVIVFNGVVFVLSVISLLRILLKKSDKTLSSADPGKKSEPTEEDQEDQKQTPLF